MSVEKCKLCDLPLLELDAYGEHLRGRDQYDKNPGDGAEVFV
jgi:hypothetical protein